MSIKAIQMDGQTYKGSELIELSKMPGRTELQGQVISLAMSAGSGLISLVKGPGSTVAGQIKSLVEKLEK